MLILVIIFTSFKANGIDKMDVSIVSLHPSFHEKTIKKRLLRLLSNHTCYLRKVYICKSYLITHNPVRKAGKLEPLFETVYLVCLKANKQPKSPDD